MSEEGKYYTPSIEEFHVGFEYELLKRKSVYDAEWKFEIIKRVFDVNVVSNSYDWARFNIDLKDKEIRVKYLDRDDIESLGWKDWSKMGIYEIREQFPEGSSGSPEPVYRLIVSTIPHKIEIRCDHPSIQFGNFMGIIKNKSELKKVMNQLGIKNK